MKTFLLSVCFYFSFEAVIAFMRTHAYQKTFGERMLRSVFMFFYLWMALTAHEYAASLP